MPAPALLADLALLLEAGEHPIEVVLLDAHLLGDLGDGDARVAADEVQGLLAARARAPRPAALAVARRRPAAARRRAPATGRAGRRALRADAVQRRDRGLQTMELVHQWTQLLQTLLHLAPLFVQEIRHEEKTFVRVTVTGSQCHSNGGDGQCGAR